jgi:hypothetical protein
VEQDATIFMALSPERLWQHMNPKHSFNIEDNAIEFSNPDCHNTEKITAENWGKKCIRFWFLKKRI